MNYIFPVIIAVALINTIVNIRMIWVTDKAISDHINIQLREQEKRIAHEEQIIKELYKL